MKQRIHPSAIVHAKAVLGNDVTIGAYSIVHEDVTLGDGSVVDAYCEIGYPTTLAKNTQLTIGKGAVIRSGATIYQGSTIGANLHLGHNTLVRENSFIGDGFQLGNNGEVQGDCEIGQYVRCHSGVHIGKMSKIGNYIWMFPNVLLTNDPVPPSEKLVGVQVADFAVICSGAILFPGVKIHEKAVVGAGSIVKTDVAQGTVVEGAPAKEICPASILRMPGDPKSRAYPWNQRFFRGYPESIVQEWKSKNEK